MSALRYFAYGSNLDAEQMRVRCPGSAPLFRAHLDDHRIDFTRFSRRWQGGCADVVREPGERVWGMVYALGADDLEKLDGFEGGYDRIALHVEDAEGTRVETVSYSVRVKEATHPPHEVYLGKMLDWGERWAFPDEYLERLRAFRAR